MRKGVTYPVICLEGLRKIAEDVNQIARLWNEIWKTDPVECSAKMPPLDVSIWLTNQMALSLREENN